MLEDTTAFVTGASRGIGRVIAETLADHGASVALAARSDGIHETADRIDAPDRTLPVRTDVTDEESVRESIEATVEAFGGLDCLVNNAGIPGPTAPVEEVDVETFAHTLQVNTVGAFVCAKHAAPHLRESDRGSVVSVSSVGAKKPAPNRTPYAASKMALVGFNRALSHELAPEVTANVIVPGAVEGDRVERVLTRRAEKQGRDPDELVRELVEGYPMEEMVPPEEVGELVAYLAGPNGRHVTGQDINITSGAVWY